jgi:hypothetical protein
VSAIANVVRTFHEGAEVVTLERIVTLPFQPTMGTRLDLRAHGVEDALEVVAVTVRAHPPGPGFFEADPDVYVTPEPLAHATLARDGGWRDV